MTGPKRTTAAGSNFAFIGWYDESGQFLVGGSLSAPADGDQDGNPFARITGIKSGSPTIGENESAPVTGDDGLISEIDFENIDTRQFVITVAVQDLELAANINNVNTFDVAGATFMPLDGKKLNDRNAVIILQSKAEDVSDGDAAWSGVFALTCTTKYLGRESLEERTAGDFRFSITPKLASYLPWGITVNNSVHGETQMRYTPFSSEYPMHIQVWAGSGSEATFNLKHDPAGVDSLAVFVDRVQATVSSLSSNALTLDSAPGAGRPIVGLYQFAGYNA